MAHRPLADLEKTAQNAAVMSANRVPQVEEVVLRLAELLIVTSMLHAKLPTVCYVPFLVSSAWISANVRAVSG